LIFTPDEWLAFLKGVRAGEFDITGNPRIEARSPDRSVMLGVASSPATAEPARAA
jgi:hypothetical protein